MPDDRTSFRSEKYEMIPGCLCVYVKLIDSLSMRGRLDDQPTSNTTDIGIRFTTYSFDVDFLTHQRHASNCQKLADNTKTDMRSLGLHRTWLTFVGFTSYLVDVCWVYIVPG